jgi:hypothetical protein
VISAATSPAAGAVHLAFDAERATEFDVLQKGRATSVYPSSPTIA